MDIQGSQTKDKGNGNGKSDSLVKLDTAVAAHQDAEARQGPPIAGEMLTMVQGEEAMIEAVTVLAAAKLASNLQAMVETKLELTMAVIKERHIRNMDKVLLACYKERAYRFGYLPRPQRT